MKSSSNLLKLLLASCLTSVLVACGNHADTTAAVTGFALTSSSTTLSADAFTPAAASGTTSGNAASSPMKVRNLSTAPTPTAFNLGAPAASQSAMAAKFGTPLKAGKPLQIGFSRNVSQTASMSATRQSLKWQDSRNGGKVVALSFTSAGAKGLRIGLLIDQLPSSSIVRFYASSDATSFEVTGQDINAVVVRNVAGGDTTSAGRTYWSHAIEGAEGTVEIELPAGEQTENVKFAVPKISHMYVTQNAAAELTSMYLPMGNDPEALSCQIDVNCTSPTPTVRNSVTMLGFREAATGNEYTCSGNLMNDSINSGTPYILTANHCISDQTTASSIWSFWFYRSNACGPGDSIGGGNTGFPQGMTLLFTSFNTDSTLLFMHNSPNPATYGALFAGWDANPPNLNIAVTNIHHPRAYPQRISSGTANNYILRNSLDSIPVPTTQAMGSIIEVVLNSGVVDAGSSGSALFKNLSTNPQVIGQLYGAYQGVCSMNTSLPQFAYYGRFDLAYAAGMSDWLNPVGNKPVARYYNTQSGTHFYTIRASEKTYVKDFPRFSFESEPFKASVEPVAGLNPVHRFYNLNLGVYFYTISESERAFVAANLPQMRYEGIAWYAQPGPGGSTIPLYRFYNRDKGVHFYTVSATERASVIANLKQMNDEGIAYYVLP